MFGQKKAEDDAPVLLDEETRFVALLNREVYEWLGKRYEWYNKIRTAKKGGLKLFADASLEEQMEATRSALNLVMKTLNGGLMIACNQTIDAVGKGPDVPEGWPAKIEGDRSEPPMMGSEHDALVLSYHPLKFLNMVKAIRDKGKGLDFYTDGLVKKLYFKVVSFYSEPRHWSSERLGFFLQGLDSEAALQEVQGKLGALKTEVELFTASLIPFKFGRSPRRKDAGAKNTMDETFEISDSELVHDLYFQSYLVHGVEVFAFRYYLTLLTATNNVRALKQISNIFAPLLAKVEEFKQRFQGSFLMERDKIRLRKDYLAFATQRDALPPMQVEEVKGKKVRRLNFTQKRTDQVMYPRGMQFGPRGVENWKQFLASEVLNRLDTPLGCARLVEVMNALVNDTHASMEGKIAVARGLREYADEQEKMGQLQINQKKKALDLAKRSKGKERSKFKSQEQANMVATLDKEIAELEAHGQHELEQMAEAIAKRREAQLQRVGQLEMAAKQDREENQGKNAGVLYRLARSLDESGKLKENLVPYLVRFIQEDKDDIYDNLYRSLFTVLPDLSPTEKMILRGAVNQKFPLEDGEMVVSDEELAAYKEQIDSRKNELNTEVPGILEMALNGAPMRMKVGQLLELGIQPDSLRLLFAMPYNAPNKPATKLPGEAIKKLLIINQLAHPMPEHDLVLPNVDVNAPAAKRLNFNRLQKLAD